LPIVKVRLGPALSRAYQLDEAKELLADCGYGDVKVVHSHNTHRL
jgi:hypothetical protein